MSIKYSKLPSQDEEMGERRSAFDFNSAFMYSSGTSSKYKSMYTYTGDIVEIPMDERTVFVKQTFMSKCCEVFITILCIIIIILTVPFSLIFALKMIPQGERLVVFRLGKLKTVKRPGMAFTMPCIDRIVKVNMGMRAFNVPPLQVFTGDGAVIELGADVQFQITCAEKSVTNVQDLNHASRELVKATLVNQLVTYKMSEINANKSNIADAVLTDSNKTSDSWGLEIKRLELSQIKVIKAPTPSSAPTMVCPPGLFSSGSEEMPEVIQQLSSIIMTAAGQISQAQQPPALPNQPSLPPTKVEEPINLEDLPPLSPSDLLKAVQTVVTESLVKRVLAVYQFEISGDGGGMFYLDLKHGSGSTGEGLPPLGEADAIMQLTIEDMQLMFLGKLKPLQAYMNGRLKVSGDLASAMKLEDVLKQLIPGK